MLIVIVDFIYNFHSVKPRSRRGEKQGCAVKRQMSISKAAYLSISIAECELP